MYMVSWVRENIIKLFNSFVIIFLVVNVVILDCYEGKK